MITIGILASWFLCSAFVYGVLWIIGEVKMNEDRGFSTWSVLFSQGMGALITWGVTNAIH